MKYLSVILFCVLSTMYVSADNVAEAKRFFGEYEARLDKADKSSYLREGEWENVKAPLETATALDPDNPLYRRELIVFKLTKIRDERVNWRIRLDLLRDFLKEAEAFHLKYPNYSHSRGRFVTNSGGGPIDTLYSLPVRLASDSERIELAGIFAGLRKLRDLEIRQLAFYRELNLSDGINSAHELLIYGVCIRGNSCYHWYYDTTEAVRETYQQGLEFYSAMRDFLVKHPEARRQKLETYNLIEYFSDVDMDHWHQPETVAEFQKIFSDFNELTTLVKEINYEAVTVQYYNWLALAEFVKSDHSKKALTKAIFNFYENLERHTSKKDGDLSNFSSIIKYFTPKDGDYRTLNLVLRQVRGEYEMMKAAKGNFTLYLADLKSRRGSVDVERLKRFVPELRSSAFAAICDNATHNALCWLESQLRGSKPSPGQRKLLDELNSVWNIRELLFANRTCLAAAELDKKYFLLFRDSFNMLKLAQFNSEEMFLEELPFPKLKAQEFQPQGCTIYMSTSGGHLIFGGGDYILLYDLAVRKWTLVEDLPGFNVVSAVIFHGRCYVLLGGRAQFGGNGGSKEMLSMSSFALDGSKRKLHFSNRRADKLTPLDSLPQGKLSDLIELPNGKLIFAVVFSNAPALLYCFDPATESFEKLREFENTSSLSLCDQGDFILGNCFGFGERLFTLDKETLKLEYLLSQSKRDSRWPKANRVKHLKGMWELQAPFLLADGFLISAFSWRCPLVLNLEKPEDSPLLMVPAGVNLFRLKEKTYLFVGRDQLSIAELK